MTTFYRRLIRITKNEAYKEGILDRVVFRKRLKNFLVSRKKTRDENITWTEERMKNDFKTGKARAEEGRKRGKS